MSHRFRRRAGLLGIACLAAVSCVAPFGHRAAAATQTRTLARPGANAPRFHAAPSYKAVADGDTSAVNTIAAADFNKRHGPDVATVQADGMLNVLYNDGHGHLGNAYHNNSAVALKVGVTYIQAADLNRDGYPDLVAMDARNNAFLVFLNNADGTFAKASPVQVTMPSGARLAGGGLTVADVNHDGIPDVVAVARQYDEATSTTALSQQTFLGNGDGTFRALAATGTSLQGYYSLDPGSSLAVADMDRDGKSDLVLQLYESSPQEAIVLGQSTGNGDGTFQPVSLTAVSVAAGPQPASSLRLRDLNGDGIPDAVFLSYSDRVFVALGRPNGAFAKPSPVLSDMSGAVTLTLGNFNHDGKPDLVVFGSGQLGVYAGTGIGTFRQAPLGQYTGGYGIYQQSVPADFNRDHNPDIAWLDYTNGQVTLYFGKGNGTFTGASPVHPANHGSTEWAANIEVITSGDFNGDGHPDVLAYEWQHASAGGPADLYVGLNDGKGHFYFKLALPAGYLSVLGKRYEPFSIDNTTADLTGDGRADVILRTGSGLSVLLANPDGTLSTNPIDVSFPVPVGCLPFNYLSVGDVNGDGHQDIVASYAQNTNCRVGSSTPSGFFTLLGDGSGHFNATFTPFGNALYFVRVADMNADGRPDVLAADLDSGSGFKLDIVPGNGDGSFDTSHATVAVASQLISNILVGDYNGDGTQDLALSTSGTLSSSGSTVPGTQGVLLLPGKGDFTFGAATLLVKGASSIWNGTAFADLNGDRRPDLVFSTYAASRKYMPDFGMIAVPNLGDGTFGSAVSEDIELSGGASNASVFTGDFNGDGTQDVLLGAGTSSPLFLNQGG